MHCSRLALSIAAWSGGLTVKSDAVAQVVRTVAGRGGRATPVRGIVAARAIFRGEKLCVVPESHILHGENSTRLLQRAAAEQLLPNDANMQRRLSTIVGDPSILSTRDALLILLAMHVLRGRRLAHPLAGWASCLPPRVPPMGVLLQQHHAGRTSFEPLQRRLRIGDQTALLEPGDGDTAGRSTELILQAAEKHGIENAGMPHTEIVASQALMTSFYRGTRHSLTQRQHEAAAAQYRHVESLATHQLLQLEESLHSSVLEPLVRGVYPSLGSSNNNNNNNNNNNGENDVVSVGCDTEDKAHLIEKLRWSHFMLRSRAVNLHPQRLDQPQIALVPFLDMLNHSVRDANVSYQYRPGVGVVIVASQPIKTSEELAINYGDYRQRGCLFSPVAAGHNAKVEGASAAMHRIESRQMREWDDVSIDDHVVNDHVEDAPFGHGLQKQQQERACNDANKNSSNNDNNNTGEEARTEATWLWRFGFQRSEDEKAYIASRLWSKGLRQRIAHLTDVRRKGRPGEFVIGVPEGLQHLREQRERLERERFGGAAVFPPQNV